MELRRVVYMNRFSNRFCARSSTSVSLNGLAMKFWAPSRSARSMAAAVMSTVRTSTGRYSRGRTPDLLEHRGAVQVPHVQVQDDQVRVDLR